MILINGNWESITDIDDITRIISEYISSDFADDVKYIYYQKEKHYPYRVTIDNCCIFIYKPQDLIDIISEKINYEFSKIVETKCLNSTNTTTHITQNIREHNEHELSTSDDSLDAYTNYKGVHTMSAIDKFRKANRLFLNSSERKISRIESVSIIFDDYKKYTSALKKYYSSYGIDMYDKENIELFYNFYSSFFQKKWKITKTKIEEDLKTIQYDELDIITDFSSYWEKLKNYYNIHGTKTELLAKIFTERYELEQFDITPEDVLDDLHKIMTTEIQIPSIKQSIVSNSSINKQSASTIIENSVSNVSETIKNKIDDELTFLMQIDDVFTIRGRGIVVTGTITKGKVAMNDDLILKRLSGEEIPVTAYRIEFKRKLIDEALTGDSIGIMLKGITTENEVSSGDILTNLFKISNTELKELQKQFLDIPTSNTKSYDCSTKDIHEETVKSSNNLSEEDYNNILKKYIQLHKDNVFCKNILVKIQSETHKNMDDITTSLNELMLKIKNPCLTNASTSYTAKSKTETEQSYEHKNLTKKINENDLFNNVKTMPIKFDYTTSVTGKYQDINTICSTFMSDKTLTSAIRDEVIMNMEQSIQVKRQRNPIQSNHDRSMENNLLYEMYKYSYLMNTIIALEQHKSDDVTVNFQNYWSMIQNDCMARIKNIEQEKRTNPAINTILRKYVNDNRKISMRILSQISARENDYITVGLMNNALMMMLYSIFNGATIQLDNSSSQQKILQIITKYPAKDVCMIIDSHIVNLVVLRTSLYAGGSPLGWNK